MDFDLSTEDEAFREEFRGWLAEHKPPDVDVAATFEEAETLRDWQRTLHSGRWVGIHWPEEYGGRGASLLQVAIYNEELARAQAPQILGRAGVNLVGPTLIAHGTEVQRAQWLPKILSAEEIWCQLFSEPGAGSDLASLSTRARRVDGGWRLDGQKVWTSYAQFADWGWCLARTDTDAPKSKGISALVVDMHSPGVEVRPLRQITDESEFNEVFFTDVFIPTDRLVGPEHGGWQVADSTLTHERGVNPRQLVIHAQVVEEVWRLAVERGALDHPRV